MRTKSERINLYITFYFFFKTKNKRREAKVMTEYNTWETYNGKEQKIYLNKFYYILLCLIFYFIMYSYYILYFIKKK